MYRYLFKLQESGRTNMFGAVPYILGEFPQLIWADAEEILLDWMKRYSEIQKELGL